MKKLFCPNFNNSSVRHYFSLLTETVGEDYAYFMWNNNEGLPLYLKNENGKEVDNLVYNKLLDIYEGNHSEAIKATIVLNSKPFKEKYKNSSEMTFSQLKKSINEYLNDNNKSLTDILETQLYRSVHIPKSESYSSIELKNIRNTVRNQTESSEEIEERLSGLQKLEAVIDYKSNPISKFMKIKNFQNIIDSDSFAKWIMDSIRLHKGSDYTDLYHESWHGFTQMFLSKAEKIALYNHVKNLFGKVKIDGVEVSYHNLTFTQIDELLAENYRQFSMRMNKTNFDNNGIVKSTFEKIQGFFNNFFSLDKKTPIYALQQDPKVLALFNSFREGNISNYKYDRKNATRNVLNRTKEIELEVTKPNGEVISEVIPNIEMSEIFEGISFWLSDSLKSRNLKISALRDYKTNQILIPLLFEDVKVRFQTYYEQIVSELNSLDENDSAYDDLNNRHLTLKWILASSESGDNWAKIVKSYREFNKDGLFNPSVKDDQDRSEENDYDETEAGRNQAEKWEEVSVDPTLLMSPTIKEIVKMLPDINDKGQLNYSPLMGLPKLSGFHQNKNMLLDKLSGLRDYSKIYQTVSDLIEFAPQLKNLLNELPSPEKPILTMEELRTKNEFIQSFTLSDVSPYSVRADVFEKDGKKFIKTTTFDNNNMTADTLLDRFDQDFRENPDRKYRLVEDNMVTNFNINQVFLDYNIEKKILSDFDYFNFLREVFGVDLIQGNTEMFDDKGFYIKDSVSYITAKKLKNIREYVEFMYRKMALLQMISKSTNISSDLKKQVNLKNIEAPFMYFGQEISKSLTKTILKEPKIKTIVDGLEKEVEHPIVKQYNSWFKQTTIYGQKKLFFETISFVYNRDISNSYLNEEDNNEWSLKERNAILSEAEKINAAQNVSELPEYYTPKSHPFMRYSQIMNRLFALNGNQKRREAVNGEQFKIKTSNFSGMKLGSEKGKKTTNLSPEDKFVQDFISFLQDGVFENIRYGSKSSSYTTIIGNNKKERLFYDYKDFTEENEILPGSVKAQYVNYLEYEMFKMFLNQQRVNAGNPTPKDILGTRLFMFREILSDRFGDPLTKEIGGIEQPVWEFIENNIKTMASIEDFKDFLNVLYREINISSTVQEGLETILKKEIGLHVEMFVNAISPDNKEMFLEKVSKLIPKPDQSLYTQEQFELLVAYYVMNYHTQQIEFANLFTGSVENYQIKKQDLSNNNFRELFKRFGLSATPGKEAVLDKQSYDTINFQESHGKIIQSSLGFPVVPRTDRYKVVVRKDVKTFNPLNKKSKDIDDIYEILKQQQLEAYADSLARSESKTENYKVTSKHRKQALEDIGESIDDVLNQEKESDAQSYANPDFIKFYLDSIGEWTPKMNEAYEKEVEIAKAIKTYRENPSAENRTVVTDLIENADGILSGALKLGHYGRVASKMDEIFVGKYSVLPLLPSVVFDTDMEDQLFEMMRTDTDMLTFKSAAKMGLPAKLSEFYSESKTGSNYTINKISPEEQFEVYVDGLRRQQYMAPKFKNKATLSTQLVKLLFSNFYENGVISDYIGNIPGLTDKINKAKQQFINSLQTIVESELSKIYLKIGAELDKDGRIINLDYFKFEKWLKSEFDKKDVNPVLYDFIKANKNGFNYSLDVSPQRSVIENVITSALNKKVLRPKLLGEAYVQIASTGFNKRNTRYKKLDPKNYGKTLEKYGLTGLLRDYRIENGVTMPADVAVTFNPSKHKPLLNLEFGATRVSTIENLNSILLGDTEEKQEWLKKHSQKFIMVGVRIPVQGFNSMEYFNVRRFLPTSIGPTLLVPPSIVTKSGSDFDIDKLYMYEPSFTDSGNLVEDELSEINVNDNDSFYEKIKNKNYLNQTIKELKHLLKPYKTIAIAQSEIDFELKKLYLKEISEMREIITDLDVDHWITNKDVINLNDGTERSKLINLEIKLKTLEEKSKRIYKNYYSKNPALSNYVKELGEKFSELKKIHNFTSENTKKVGSNTLIKSFQTVLSEPAIYKFLTKPNESKILKPLGARYFTHKSVNNRITPFSMYLPRISNAIYGENTLGKKALGVDAKTNALHKLYQQTGLRMTYLSNHYGLRSNKFEIEPGKYSLILGGLKDAMGINYISDIINEFINGHVDIEKEDWINYFNADRARTPIMLQMILNGTPIEDVLLVCNQPVIQHYIKTKNKTSVAKFINKTTESQDIGERKLQVKNNYKKRKSEGSEFTMMSGSVEDYYIEMLDVFGLKPVYNKITGLFSESQTISMILKQSVFKSVMIGFNTSKRTDGIMDDKYAPEVNVSKERFNRIYSQAVANSNKDSVEKLAEQLYFFTQYRVAELQNEKLLKLNTVVDFNTSKYQSAFDFNNVGQTISQAYNFFEAEGLTNLVQTSVVSPFDISNVGTSLFNNLFDVFSNPEFQKILRNYKNVHLEYKSTYDTNNELNALQNAIVHFYFQKLGYSGTTGREYHYYGPKSSTLVKNYNSSSLNTRFADLKNINDVKVKKFLKTNLLAKNLTFRVVKGADVRKIDGKMYNRLLPVVRTNEKNSDLVGDMQMAWLNATTFNFSTEENNNKVQGFFKALAASISLQQGYNKGYRTLQPLIPLELLPLEEVSQYFKSIKHNIEGSEFEKDVMHVWEIYSKKFKKGYTAGNKHFPDYLINYVDYQASKFVNPSTSDITQDGKFEISLNSGLGSAFLPNTLRASNLGILPETVNLSETFGINMMYVFSDGVMSTKLVEPGMMAAYPLEIKGKLFGDLLTAYEFFKENYKDRETQLLNYLIKLRYKNYMKIFNYIYANGGIKFLENATFVEADREVPKEWLSDKEDLYLTVMKSAYTDLLAEIEVEERGETVVSQEQNENNDYYEDNEDNYDEEENINTEMIVEENQNIFESSLKAFSDEKIQKTIEQYGKETLKLMTYEELEKLGLNNQELSVLIDLICK